MKTTISNEIELHGNSVGYLNGVFQQYERAEFTRDTKISNPIVHLYAVKDTRDEQGELHGHVDALFFKAFIYDTVSLKQYATSQLHDSIDLFDASPWQTKIFKDGSTMLNFHGEYTFNPLTSLVVTGCRD